MRTVGTDYCPPPNSGGTLSPSVTGLPVSVRTSPYNAYADNKHDDTQAIQRALDSGNTEILIPAGNYRITSPLVVPAGVSIIGVGLKSNLVADGVTGGVLRTRPVNNKNWFENQKIEKLNISGTSDTGINWHGSVTGTMRDITMKGLTASIGFDLYNTWGCQFSNFWTNGATISDTCFMIRSNFNANNCNNWYTSNLGVNYNFIADNSSADGDIAGGSGGSTWNNLCLQGGRLGMWLKYGESHTFNSLYSEACISNVKLGDAANSLHPYNITLNSPLFSYTGNPNNLEAIQLEIDSVWGLAVNAPTFVYSAESNSKAVVYNECYRGVITGGYVQGSGIYIPLSSNIYRRASASSDCGITLINNGDKGRFEMMVRADNYSHQTFVMTVNSSGQWVSTPITIPQV